MRKIANSAGIINIKKLCLSGSLSVSQIPCHFDRSFWYLQGSGRAAANAKKRSIEILR